MKGNVYHIIGALSAFLGLASLGIALVFAFGAAFVGVLGFLFGLGEASLYGTWGRRLINLAMHVLPGATAALFAWVSFALGALLFWGAWVTWRRGSNCATDEQRGTDG